MRNEGREDAKPTVAAAESTPAPPPPKESPPAHEHRSVGSDRRVWLEILPDEAATMRLHWYCQECGAVKTELPLRGRPMGYFDQAVSTLKILLEDHPKYRPLAQVQSHLISKALRDIPDFDDPYSMAFGIQWDLFLHTVQRVRPDIPIDLIEEALPREPRKRRAAYIDVIAPNQGGLQGSPLGK